MQQLGKIELLTLKRQALVQHNFPNPLRHVLVSTEIYLLKSLFMEMRNYFEKQLSTKRLFRSHLLNSLSLKTEIRRAITWRISRGNSVSIGFELIGRNFCYYCSCLQAMN